jgi:hypothetical protein
LISHIVTSVRLGQFGLAILGPETAGVEHPVTCRLANPKCRISAWNGAKSGSSWGIMLGLEKSCLYGYRSRQM